MDTTQQEGALYYLKCGGWAEKMSDIQQLEAIFINVCE